MDRWLMGFDQESGPELAPSPADLAPPRGAGSNLWLTILAVALAVALVVIYLIDRTTSHTALITPINPVGLTVMRALGTFGGLLLAFVTLGRSQAIYRKVLFSLMLPLGGFALGDGIAWRIADHWDFEGSSEPFAQARYPIVNVKGGGKSHTYSLGIDPYGTGEAARIGIPYTQYLALSDNFAGQCVTINRRSDADGAVEISTVPANVGPNGEIEVVRCAIASPWK